MLLDAVIRRVDDMIATKTAITGGVGSRHSRESFGDRFELPPDRAYNETCAAIASIQLCWRLLLATGEPRFAELIERTLVNSLVASTSVDGGRYFYVNPLQRRPDHAEGADPGERREWFECACCPPNIMRTYASLAAYLASVGADGTSVFLHQLFPATVTVGGAGTVHRVRPSRPWQRWHRDRDRHPHRRSRRRDRARAGPGLGPDGDCAGRRRGADRRARSLPDGQPELAGGRRRSR